MVIIELDRLEKDTSAMVRLLDYFPSTFTSHAYIQAAHVVLPCLPQPYFLFDDLTGGHKVETFSATSPSPFPSTQPYHPP